MNPYDPPELDASNETDTGADDHESLGCFGQLIAHAILAVLNLAFYILVGVLYYLGGNAAIVGVFVGLPVALLATFALLYWLLVPTPEQRREYLREKRRKIRAARKNGG